MNYEMAIAAFGIGIVIGLTGMGGGALMTPTLVLLFNVPPLTAVSSDLVVSAATKPVGTVVHMRNGTIHWKIVLWLVVGSVPAAFCGALVIAWVGPLAGVSEFVKTALGVVLLIAAAGLVGRAYLTLRQNMTGQASAAGPSGRDIAVRVVPTVLVGVIGGLVVGLTSVGSGSLVIIALMTMYPLLTANRLVGTDLAQAVPLVIAAAAGHLLFGDVDWSVVLPLLVGSIPGAYFGARLSSRASAGLVRRALALVLLTAGLKMLGVSNLFTLVGLGIALVAGTVGWMLVRTRYGLKATNWQDRRVTVRIQNSSD
ncbi:sulfite exporter TauE/SafE family protein [Gordonia sp. (in: high G+C Gram-positive bacteria)]|uniref:sulfite exporter TauE/SafE family protein n=1 Tax=Gordonia sp. (in: high G+C Gram-positive bacteria) TaxID=84139 RepID=UPI002580629A|nr:sulfite exporter TauE/SafE family protein [Gordonia sp. (in: high G+C Gram-positive bacteria)]